MLRTVLFSPCSVPVFPLFRGSVAAGLCLLLLSALSPCSGAAPSSCAHSPEKPLPVSPPLSAELPALPEGARIFRQALMGTAFTLTLLPERGKSLREMESAANDAFALAERLQRIASAFDAESELSRLNRARPHEDLALSAGLFSLLSRAREIAALSGGAFDPALGAESRLWRRARSRGVMPSDEELAEARARSGYRGLLLNPEKQTARKTRPGLLVDLGGIGKGAAADLMAGLLRQRGFPRFCLSTTSDVLAGEPPPGMAGWPVRLSHGGKTLRLRNQAVSTSGTTRQSAVLAGGSRYAHLIDAKTGFGTTRSVCASVVAPDSATADAASTALVFLPADKRDEFCRRLSLTDPVITEYPDSGPAPDSPAKQKNPLSSPGNPGGKN